MVGDLTVEQIYTFITHLATLMGSCGVVATYILKQAKKQIDKNVAEAINPIHDELKDVKEIIKNDKQDYIEGILCVLRNEILSIYCNTKDNKEITIQQKQAINYSFQLYENKGGNSFVKDIVEEMNTYKVIGG